MFIVISYLALVFAQFHTKMSETMNFHFMKLITGSWEKITYVFTFNEIDTRCMGETSHACSYVLKLIQRAWEINQVFAAIP